MESISLEDCFRWWTVRHLHQPVFQLLLEASTGNLSQMGLTATSYNPDHTHSLAAFNGQLSSQQTLVQTKNCRQHQKWTPYKVRGLFLYPFVHKRELAYPVPTKAFLQPSTTAPMCCYLEADTHPHPPIPQFLLAQNPSSNWIVQTDNMWTS